MAKTVFQVTLSTLVAAVVLVIESSSKKVKRKLPYLTLDPYKRLVLTIATVRISELRKVIGWCIVVVKGMIHNINRLIKLCNFSE